MKDELRKRRPGASAGWAVLAFAMVPAGFALVTTTLLVYVRATEGITLLTLLIALVASLVLTAVLAGAALVVHSRVREE